MKPAEKVFARMLVVGMFIGLIWGTADHTVQAAEQTGETSQNVASASPTWSGGTAVGFLSNTPDGTAFAFNLHADRFLQRNVSFGPLLQLGFTGDLTQIGFSGQGKYWIDLPETDNRAKVVLQAGIGFVHADYFRNDTSFLIPLGIGVDYALNRTVSLTGTFLLNFTDLDTGPRTDTNVMPGLTFGVRF
ncbi:MAG: hypothetical protein ACREI1_10845 [Nitrospiraceae bacterium]